MGLVESAAFSHHSNLPFLLKTAALLTARSRPNHIVAYVHGVSRLVAALRLQLIWVMVIKEKQVNLLFSHPISGKFTLIFEVGVTINPGF